MVKSVWVEVDGKRYLMGNRWRGGSSVNYFSRHFWDMPNARHYAQYENGKERLISNTEAHMIISSWG